MTHNFFCRFINNNHLYSRYTYVLANFYNGLKNPQALCICTQHWWCWLYFVSSLSQTLLFLIQENTIQITGCFFLIFLCSMLNNFLLLLLIFFFFWSCFYYLYIFFFFVNGNIFDDETVLKKFFLSYFVVVYFRLKIASTNAQGLS